MIEDINLFEPLCDAAALPARYYGLVYLVGIRS